MGTDSGKRGGAPLATVTHARLRASQGDVAGARAILETVLAANPDDAEAHGLLTRLSGARDGDRALEAEEPLAAPQAGDPAALAASFREALGGRTRRREASGVIVRFEAMLDRIAKERRRTHAR